nr:MAG TPA: Integrase [Caudoviricetes sp.]
MQGVRKRGKTWSYYFDTAKIAGERNKEEKGGFRTKKEALEARAKAIAEYNDTGRIFTPTTMSVADYLDYWLENAIKANIGHTYSYNTWRDYEAKVRLHLKPAFGKYRLSSFQHSPDRIQRWVDGMKSKGYSKNMVSNCLACLRGALTYAVTPLQYIKVNPCMMVKVGKMAVNKAAKEYAEYVCPKEEFERILRRFPEDDSFHLSLIVPYNIGTRISETFAIDLLRDFHPETHEITIDRQMCKIDGVWQFKAPKYDSYRTVKIGNTLERALIAAIRQRKVNQLRYGSHYLKTYVKPDGTIVQARSDMSVALREIMPLCVKENGKLMTPESFKYCAKVVHKELNNPLFHSHCLRHTHGTILAENGVNPKTVMERLGHKNIETTLQTYTFNTSVMQQTAVEAFERATYA